MKKTRPIIGRRLAELRCERGLSQEELAAQVGVSTRTVGNIEREKTMPDLSILIDLADLFEVSLDFLVGRSEAA